MATSLDQLSDETFDLLCSPCKRKNKNTEADKYCVDCSDYYCFECVKFHDDIPALSGHKIVDKGQFQHGTSQALPMVPTERCDKHNHKLVDMYCQNHDDVGCSTCMNVEHRSCEDISYIPDFIKTKTNVPDPKDNLTKLEATEEKLNEQLKYLQEEKARSLKSRKEVIGKIEKFAEDMKQKIDQLKDNSIKQTRDMYTPVTKITDHNLSVLQSIKSNVSTAKKNISSSDNNISQVFVCSKKCQTIASESDKYADEFSTSYQPVDIKFDADRKMLVLLSEMTTLGNVTQHHLQKVSHVTGSAKLQDSIRMYQLKNKMEYDVRVSSDKYTCNIVSVYSLSDGTVVLADLNNSKLKRVECNTFTVTDACDLPEKPLQVCVVNDQEVAVSCFRFGVRLVSLHPKMTVARQIKPDHTCIGLAYVKGHLYVSDNKSVYMYTSSGTQLNRFAKNKSGQPLFGDIYRIAVTGDSSKIYVADRNKGLICIGSAGNILGSFYGPELRGANAVLVMNNGAVLVCGLGSNNVLQFGPNCEVIGEVLKFESGRQHCQTVCFISTHLKLIVSRLLTGKIEVYDLI